MAATRSVGESKLRQVQGRGAATLTNTAAHGHDGLREEMRGLTEDFSHWNSSVTETSTQLGKSTVVIV